MTESIFGTDGIRDIAGQGLLSNASLARLTAALSRFMEESVDTHLRSPRVLIGRDSRISGPDIEARLAGGLMQHGVEVESAGIVPTPAVSTIVENGDAHGEFDLGIVVSASHNPPDFNGVKVFDRKGSKLDAASEERVTRFYHEADAAQVEAVPLKPSDRLRRLYCDRLVKGREGMFTNWRIVVDAARGAATTVAREVFERCGAKVELLNEEPDGSLINIDCGSLHPEGLAPLVTQQKARIGIAFDGDADRAIFVDDLGHVVDGDEVLALWALDLKEREQLAGDVCVATVMSNAGMESHLREHGIELVRTAVGDREVFLELERRHATLGGEQSGHVIYRPEAKTGDGLRSALHLMEVIDRAGKPLSVLRASIPRFPQRLTNVPVGARVAFDELPDVRRIVEEAERDLAGRGRVLLRYSGTESLARVLVEAPEQAICDDWARRIASVLEECPRLRS